MEIQVLSIKQAKEELKEKDKTNIKLIIVSSYPNDIESIKEEDKILLNFDDINVRNKNSFNSYMAEKIHKFIESIEIERCELYICCDSGVSRSSAIAAAILRKYNEDEDAIWKNYKYHPNLLVYEELCKEFGLENNRMRLKKKAKINANALKKQINKTRELNKNILSRILKIKM